MELFAFAMLLPTCPTSPNNPSKIGCKGALVWCIAEGWHKGEQAVLHVCRFGNRLD
jgi:hypothetical protein